MLDLEFWSPDRRFGLLIPSHQADILVKECQNARGNETGGVLVGSYTTDHHCAVVTRVCAPPMDSRAGRTWFHRGVRGLQQILDSYWKRGAGFYLGEWHFHPNAAPIMSPTDDDSIRGIATSARYNCPEPILLIVGGDPTDLTTVSAAVFPRGVETVPLIASTTPTAYR